MREGTDLSRIGLTEVESRVLAGCGDVSLTRRRMRQVMVMSAIFAALLAAFGWWTRSWALVLGVSLLYIAITTWEKLGYGRGVLVYKAIIRKLLGRLDELS